MARYRLITCPNCGLTFPVSTQAIEECEKYEYSDIYCPDCGDEIPVEDLEG